MVTNDNERWAWLTGIFEGEGCITFRSRGSGVVLRVSMTDFDVVHKCHEISGRGRVNGPYLPHSTAQEVLHWTVSRADDVEFVLHRMLPRLGERRTAKAQEALGRLTPVDHRHRSGPLSVGDICKNEHLITEDGLYRTMRGYVGCRECKRSGERRRWAEGKK